MAYRQTAAVAERLADKRRLIIKAVRQVVAEVGFRDAQITMVVAASGISTGTVYRHFGSKAELYAEAVSVNSQYELDILLAIANSDGPAVDRIEDAIRVFASRALRVKRLAWAMIAEPVDAEVDVTRMKYRRAYGDMFRDLIEEGIAAGDLPPQNSAASAACFFGALIEGLIGPLAPGAARPTEESRLIDAIVTFCLRAIGTSPSDPLAQIGDKYGTVVPFSPGEDPST